MMKVYEPKKVIKVNTGFGKKKVVSKKKVVVPKKESK